MLGIGPRTGGGAASVLARVAALAASVAALLTPVGCLPVPDVKVPLLVQPPAYRVAPERVQRETFWIDTPSAPSTPSEFDRTGVRRTYLPEVAPRVIIVAMPGLFGGATTFDPWARQLVASEPSIQVWAIDRRANALEDREGILRAMAADDPEVARDYYARGGGFSPIDPAEVAFMAHWGLQVHLRDLQQVVLRASEEAEAVMLAGHSLGAGIISVYAAARIRPDQGGGFGEDYIEGLILLDGSVGRTGSFGWADERVAALGVTLVPSVDDLESGRVAPYLRTWIGLGPERYVRYAVAATYAQLRPCDLAPPGSAPYPVTNRALAGIRADDDYALTPVFSVSVGEAVGARFAGNLTAFILTGTEAARSRTVAGVAEGASHVTWSAGDPSREVSDLDEIVASWTDPDADMAEWYFPLRLAVDLAALDPRLLNTPGFAPMEGVDVATLAIGAGRGLIDSPVGFQSYVNTRPGAPIAVTVVPGLTHLDILKARANPTLPIVLRWLRSEGWLPPRPR